MRLLEAIIIIQQPSSIREKWRHWRCCWKVKIRKIMCLWTSIIFQGMSKGEEVKMEKFFWQLYGIKDHIIGSYHSGRAFKLFSLAGAKLRSWVLKEPKPRSKVRKVNCSLLPSCSKVIYIPVMDQSGLSKAGRRLKGCGSRPGTTGLRYQRSWMEECQNKMRKKMKR